MSAPNHIIVINDLPQSSNPQILQDEFSFYLDLDGFTLQMGFRFDSSLLSSVDLATQAGAYDISDPIWNVSHIPAVGRFNGLSTVVDLYPRTWEIDVPLAGTDFLQPDGFKYNGGVHRASRLPRRLVPVAP
ncbi:MAG: hypothetical protein P1V35_08230 [Planctomycetota bacterium]|nr:hypothetical protein [Planctomycetota bacterium]